MRRFSAVFLAGFLFAAGAAQGASADESWLTPGLGDGWGVQVKEERTSDEELDKIKAAGLDYVRFVIPWYAVEKGKDSFVWGYFDSFVKRLREKKLKAVIVIGAGHPSYTQTVKAPEGNLDHVETYLAAPSSPEESAAFARYAARTVEHFGTDGIVWELWNEPDSDRFWAPKADVKAYIATMQAACRAMREVAPDARIVGPGMADTPGRFGALVPGFLGKVLRSPVSACLDGVSVHPYRDGEKPPETVLGAYEKLRAYIKAFTPKGQKDLPVLSTEWGFTLTDTSEEEQAAYLLRSFLLNSLSGVPVSIWYEWRDARSGADDPEAHFGLLDLRRKEKPSYKALAAFLPPLKGARFEKRLSPSAHDSFVLLLRRPEGQRFVVFWSSAATPAATLRLTGGAYGEGRELPLTALPQALPLGAGEDVQVSLQEGAR